jgi:hypothetical protein
MPEGQQVSPVHPQPVKNQGSKKEALGKTPRKTWQMQVQHI